MPVFGLPLSLCLLGSTAYIHGLEPNDTGFISVSAMYSVCLGNLFYLCELPFPHLSNVVSSKIAHTSQGNCEGQFD